MVALRIRLATGSAQTSLLVLAIGAGSLFFPHVDDAGFWLVKEYFGLSVGQTITTWSIMETLISVVGLVFVLLISLVVRLGPWTPCGDGEAPIAAWHSCRRSSVRRRPCWAP